MIDQKDPENFVLEELKMPTPVFMSSIEYESVKDKEKLKNCLQMLIREDNSLQYFENEETG